MTREDRIAWLSHPATQDLIQRISELREGVKEEWSVGVYSADEDKHEALGKCKVLLDVIELVRETGGVENE